MVKTIRLLGMEIKNYPLREEILRGEDFYNTNRLNTIRTVSMRMLGMAVEDEAVREGIEQADLLIMDEKEILTEAGIRSNQRIREAAEQTFLHEFLKHACRNGRTVFLTAKNSEDLENYTQFLKTAHEKLAIVGNYALEDCDGEYDTMVNEVNAVAPDIILSAIDSPLEEQFLAVARAKLGARIWYSTGQRYHHPAGERLSILLKLKQMIHFGRFKTVIHHYEDENEQQSHRCE